MIVAHRGASRDAPENTIPAFALAWSQGADAIEGDFHLTQDGHVVCIHDGDTRKVSNTNLVVRESRLSELKRLDVGAYRGRIFQGSTIPTIAEVLAIVPEQKKIYIEIKSGSEIIPSLLREIHKSGITETQVVIISFRESVIQDIKTKAPEYKAFWLCSFSKQKTGVVTPALETVLSTLKRIRADGLSSNSAIPESFISSVRKQGYEWHVWTINDLKTAKRMKAWGAVSITTDVPSHIRKGLIELRGVIGDGVL